MARILALENRKIINRMTVTLNHLLHEEESLRSKIINIRPVTCRIYSVTEEDGNQTNGFSLNAIGKIVIREVREVLRKSGEHLNYQEHFDTIYIWPELLTSKIPEVYEKSVMDWLRFIQVKYMYK